MVENNRLDEIVDFFKEMVAEETTVPTNEINIDDSFHSLGLDSINAIFVIERLEKKYEISLSPILFWDCPTIKSFSSHIHTLISNG